MRHIAKHEALSRSTGSSCTPRQPADAFRHNRNTSQHYQLFDHRNTTLYLSPQPRHRNWCQSRPVTTHPSFRFPLKPSPSAFASAFTICLSSKHFVMDWHCLSVSMRPRCCALSSDAMPPFSSSSQVISLGSLPIFPSLLSHFHTLPLCYHPIHHHKHQWRGSDLFHMMPASHTPSPRTPAGLPASWHAPTSPNTTSPFSSSPTGHSSTAPSINNSPVVGPCHHCAEPSQCWCRQPSPSGGAHKLTTVLARCIPFVTWSTHANTHEFPDSFFYTTNKTCLDSSHSIHCSLISMSAVIKRLVYPFEHE